MKAQFIVALVAVVSFFGAYSEIYIVKQGDTVELQCNDSLNISNPYRYDSNGFRMNVKRYFSQDRMQIWPRNYYYYSEYIYSSGRFNFTSTSSNLVLLISDLQFGDAGAYSCQFNSMDISTHLLIVIGREVSLTINGTRKHHLLVNNNNAETTLDCSFKISSYPWPDGTESLDVNGAVGSNMTREGSTISRQFITTITRSTNFVCVVGLPYGTFLESPPASLILKDVRQEDENYVIRSGDSSFLLSCSTLQPSNKQWKWFKERLHYGNQLSFPIVNCIITNSTEECYNQTSQHFLQDISTQAYSFLRFMNITFEATGSYFCIDDLFTVQKLFNVIIMDGAPKNMTINGQPIENNGSFDIEKGATAVVTCSILVASNQDEEGRYLPKLVVSGAQYVNHTVNDAYLTYTYETTINQSGSYKCFVDFPNDYNVIGNFSNYTINVDVFYCPEELEISSEMVDGVLEKGTILSCKTFAIPAANVSWSAANKILKLETGPNYANLRVYEKMVYTCQTKPTFHTVLGLCQTLVTSFEPDQVISRQYLSVPKNVHLGDSLTLQCNTLHHKNNNWKWIRNWNPYSNSVLEPLVDCLLQENVECSNVSISGRFQDHSSSSETQLILSAADIADSGNYTCFDSLRSVIKSYKVNVFVCPSKLVISKKNLKGETELTCSITSNPAVNVTWALSNDNKPLAFGLNSVKLVVTQNGSYRCFVPQTSHFFLGKCGELSFIEIIESYPKK